MAPASGTKLGPYEVQAPLGAGGRGEVYRARDTRLGRFVAIKILPAHLCSTSDLQARFEREARAISSLNHPNICHLYDVGSQDGISYLVIEYLEGETLADRLHKAPLPPKQVLEFGGQIAQAPATAHRAGILRRDLRPGNVMLTAAGEARGLRPRQTSPGVGRRRSRGFRRLHSLDPHHDAGRAHLLQRTQGPYDVTADGKKFLVNSGDIKEENQPLVLLQNWTAVLKKLSFAERREDHPPHEPSTHH